MVELETIVVFITTVIAVAYFYSRIESRLTRLEEKVRFYDKFIKDDRIVKLESEVKNIKILKDIIERHSLEELFKRRGKR